MTMIVMLMMIWCPRALRVNFTKGEKRLREDFTKGKQDLGRIWHPRRLREDFAEGKQDLGKISQKENKT